MSFTVVAILAFFWNPTSLSRETARQNGGKFHNLGKNFAIFSLNFSVNLALKGLN